MDFPDTITFPTSGLMLTCVQRDSTEHHDFADYLDATREHSAHLYAIHGADPWSLDKWQDVLSHAEFLDRASPAEKKYYYDTKRAAAVAQDLR